jgi:hypothetical protein
MIRVYFRYDRRLLGKLCRVAAGVITESIRSILGKPELTPGIVICVQLSLPRELSMSCLASASPGWSSSSGIAF